jgi:hypothetical protein
VPSLQPCAPIPEGVDEGVPAEASDLAERIIVDPSGDASGHAPKRPTHACKTLWGMHSMMVNRRGRESTGHVVASRGKSGSKRLLGFLPSKTGAGGVASAILRFAPRKTLARNFELASGIPDQKILVEEFCRRSAKIRQ